MWISNIIFSFKCDQLLLFLISCGSPAVPQGVTFSSGSLRAQVLTLILEQNLSASKTMVLGFNMNSITAFLKRQLWQSSTFLSFTVLFQPSPEVPFLCISLRIPKLLVLCFEQQSFLCFSNLSWKAYVRIHRTVSSLKLNFTPSSDIFKTGIQTSSLLLSTPECWYLSC